MMDKLWGGRFKGPTDELMEGFNASLLFDRRLYRVDIAGSLAYAEGLHEIGLLTEEEWRAISDGLRRVEGEIERGELELPDRLEDIHTAVEVRLTELIGPAGGKLHTGRSRNEQVALDERLYLMESIDRLVTSLLHFQSTLLGIAEEHLDTIMPGYTHLRQAQPILFSHYVMSLFWMLERDRERLSDCRRRVDCLPLGSGALAGSGFPIPRELLAKRLGFSRLSENSIDAVSDRDYVLEALATLAILMMHLSRYCEDLIIWSSSEFRFIEIDDAFATGSSMMPQKKNPDSLELIRGKAGRVYGDLVTLLVMMKGVPLTYSKDLQEDKEPLFDAVDTTLICTEVFRRVWETLRIDASRMGENIDPAVSATDLADYLVQKGLPFREAHRIVGNLVKEGKRLDTLTLDDLRRASMLFDEDALSFLDPAKGIARRHLPGGTSRVSVEAQIAEAKRRLSSSLPPPPIADDPPMRVPR
jgi:argininosuccinate lyase